MKKTLAVVAVVAVLAAFAAGIALGLVLRAPVDGRPATARGLPGLPTLPAVVLPASDDTSTVRALRAKVGDLETRLSRLAKAAKVLADINAKTAVAAKTNAAAAQLPWGSRFITVAEWLARLKATDPARYIRETNEYARMWKEHRDELDGRIDFFKSIDTSKFSDEEKATHARLLELAEANRDLEDRMEECGADKDAMEKLRQEKWDHMAKMRELCQQERDTLLRETAEAAGCPDTESQTVIDTIKTVYQSTDPYNLPPSPVEIYRDAD